ncbi:MAG: histidine kinase, partial [Bacteroidota bacterium]|nr:histidine kinase [Bacteroidota bacterium]
MNIHDLIFSNRLRHRIPRHLIFWLVLWMYFLGAYWFPSHWFPGWHAQGKVLELAQNHPSQFLSFVFSNSADGMMTQAFFAYIVIYLLLPRFLLKGKYFCLVAGVFITLTFLIFYKYSELLNIYYTSLRVYDAKVVDPDRAYLFKCAWDNIMFNCPTAGGIAVSIKLLKHWYFKQKETQQVATSKAKAELQLLKAQVHPHFLFNTLNNIYSFTLTGSPKAPEMVKKLSGLLRYILHECDQPLVPLEKELLMIQDYMALEKIRYGEQMDMTVDIRGDYSDKMIAPLLLIPFVENSFKHGASRMLS